MKTEAFANGFKSGPFWKTHQFENAPDEPERTFFPPSPGACSQAILVQTGENGGF